MNLPPNTIQTTHRRRRLTYRTRTTLAGMVGHTLAVRDITARLEGIVL